MGGHAKTATSFRRALELAPALTRAYPYLVHALLQTCAWDDLESLTERMLADLERRIVAGRPVAASPFSLAGTPASNALRLAAARAISSKIARTVSCLAPVASEPRRSRGNRILVGYVSPDFREHSLALVFHGLLQAHDRRDFEWFGYSVSPRPSLSFAPYEKLFDRFTDLGHVPIEQAVAKVRTDGIDILIDLAGHTRDFRLELFVLKPAPIQAHYLGYGSTLGADCILYLFTDPVHTPLELEHFCSEALVFLPDTFMAAPPVEISYRRFSRAE